MRWPESWPPGSGILRGADFASAQLPKVVFDACNLEGATLSQAKLGGGRFHGSNVAGLIGGASLAGIEIDPAQISDMALNVFEAIGITVTDAPGGSDVEDPAQAG